MTITKKLRDRKILVVEDNTELAMGIAEEEPTLSGTKDHPLKLLCEHRAQTTQKKYVVLVAEDEPLLREGIVYDLQKEGLEVFSVQDGKEEIELIQRQQIDLVLSDTQMPNKNGIDLLDKVNNLENTKPAFVLMTGGLSQKMEFELKQRAPVQILEKPFQHEDLLDLIFEHLKSRI